MVTDLNDFNDPAQTTNLGVRSSNLFGRAILNRAANVGCAFLPSVSVPCDWGTYSDLFATPARFFD